MELVCCLIAYIIYKIISEIKFRIERKEEETAQHDWLTNLYGWKFRVTDKELEERLTLFLNASNVTEIRKILTEAGWGHGFSIYSPYDKRNTLRLLMSLRGKLLVSDTENGIDSARIFPKSKDDELENIKSYEMVKFIDRQLRKHNICEQMYINRPGVNIYRVLDARSSHCGGAYTWAPMVPRKADIIKGDPQSRATYGLVTEIKEDETLRSLLGIEDKEDSVE